MKNTIRCKCAVAAIAACGAMGSMAAQGISDDVIRIGFITDMSGPYSQGDDLDVRTIRAAIEEMGGQINGKNIELLTADHQNKTDIGAQKAREWFDQQGLDMLIGGVNSGVAVAMSAVAKAAKKPYLVSGAGSMTLVEDNCSPYTLLWTYNTGALGRGTGTALVEEGYEKWFYITPDYTFGHALEGAAMAAVKDAGGENLGSARAPFGITDYSSFVLQAQQSGAEVLALSTAGADFRNSVKAAHEFGLTDTMKLASLVGFITDVHSLGMDITRDMYVTAPWYWAMGDETRAWSEQFIDALGRPPIYLEAGNYSAALAYLKAVEATGTDDGDTVMEYLRNNEINDIFGKGAYVREDGLVMRDYTLLQVSQENAADNEWDVFRVVRNVAAKDINAPPVESACDLSE